jgi:hypothetical protein
MLVLAGLVGGAYHINAVRSQGNLDFSALHAVDWIAHNGLPVVANVSVICGGAGLIAAKPFAPYAVAAASTLLLVSGIYAPGT